MLEPAPSRSDWRTFLSSRYRPFHAVGIGQGAVGALAGGAVTMPLLLQLGAPPPVAAAVGILPGIGALSQLVLPGILRRTDGNLRRLTLLVAALGDTRGLWLAAIVTLAAIGMVPHPLAIALIALTTVAASTLGGLSGTTLLAWYHAVLPEDERRLVSPRLGTLGSVVSVALLLPTAALVANRDLGLWAYVPPLLAAGGASLLGIAGLTRLPRPGRVRIPARAQVRAERPASLDRFVRVSCIGSFGFGIGPPLSVFAIAILGMSPGFTVGLSAFGTVASLVSSAVVATRLGRGSASRLLRVSHVVRGVAMASGLSSLIAGPFAPVLLVVAVALGAAGDAAGQLAGTERLLRLAVGRAAIAHQADYVAATSLTSVGAQLTGSAVLAVGAGAGPLPFAALFIASGVARAIVAVRLEVSPRTTPRSLSAGGSVPKAASFR